MTSFNLLSSNGETQPIPPGGLRIGRAPENDLRLDVVGVSRYHAVVWIEGGQVFIRDEGSTNGTYVNGVLLVPKQPYPLRPGDSVRIEMASLTLSLTGEVSAATMPGGAAGGAATPLVVSTGPAYTSSPPYMGVGGESAAAPDYAGMETSSDLTGGGRGWLIAGLAALGVLLIAGLVVGGLWLANRMSGGTAFAGATPTPSLALTPEATATVAGVVPMPTAQPWVTGTAAAGGAFGTPAPPVAGLGVRPVLPPPVVAVTAYPAPRLLEPPDGARFTGPNAVIVLKWASVGALAPNDYYVVTLNCARRVTLLLGGAKSLMAPAPAQVTIAIPTISVPTLAPVQVTLPPVTVPSVPPVSVPTIPMSTLQPFQFPMPTLLPLPTMLPLPTGLPTFSLPITLPVAPGVPWSGAPIQAWTKDTQWRVPPEIYQQLAGPRECTWWVMVGAFGGKLPDGTLVVLGSSPSSEARAFTWE